MFMFVSVFEFSPNQLKVLSVILTHFLSLYVLILMTYLNVYYTNLLIMLMLSLPTCILNLKEYLINVIFIILLFITTLLIYF